uniref:DUF4218 domain-containing protein n=1 Tax=Fagus sylvatica TaxID=28930 RepID=A0A2N9I4P1_FAGSY
MEDKILCPCKRCNHYFAKSRDDVEADLITIGIVPTYTRWFRHGEETHSETCDNLVSDDESDGNDLHEMVEDYFGASNAASWLAGEPSGNGTLEEPNNDATKFFHLLGDNEQKLYPNCKYMELSFIVKLLHIKCLGGWTNKSFTMLLQLFNERFFMSTKTASYMTWHHDKRVDDGLLRHPADSKAWKTFDKIHESFSLETRNVRLGLATDGFNPFGNMSLSYSIWPVVLVPYNLPPWMCMKQPNFMLSLLIPGQKGPGNDIDVYLQPLVDELKQLWEVGVTTFDSFRKQNFNMRAVVLWTINDFPAYRKISGWNTMGALACPSCHDETHSSYLKSGKKYCFMGHRRFLPIKHRWRLQSRLFDGKKETSSSPKQLFGDDVVHQVYNLGGLIFGKGVKRKRDESTNWLKKSIFFELPYWRTLLLRHNLDAMHIEKNVCDSVIGTLMNIKGKTKDNFRSRLDLQARALCQLEMIFPPSFFDVMMHLPVHLASEAMIAGPVQYRWMYPIERYLHTLKNYVRNRAHLDGSIAEGYVADECLTFCSRYLHGRGGIVSRQLSREEWMQAHQYVLKNCDEVHRFIEEHKYMIRQASARNVEIRHTKQFIEWFESHITKLYDEKNAQVNKQLLDLAQGPSQEATCYNGYIVNGFRYRKNEGDCQRKTQSCGVLVKGDSYTSNRDYYGVLTDIIELRYMGGNQIVMFKCEWWDVNNPSKGIMVDEYGRTLVNFVVKTDPRNYYNMPPPKDEKDDEEEDVIPRTIPIECFTRSSIGFYK